MPSRRQVNTAFTPIRTQGNCFVQTSLHLLREPCRGHQKTASVCYHSISLLTTSVRRFAQQSRKAAQAPSPFARHQPKNEMMIAEIDLPSASEMPAQIGLEVTLRWTLN
jgi:hypothetical protein